MAGVPKRYPGAILVLGSSLAACTSPRGDTERRSPPPRTTTDGGGDAASLDAGEVRTGLPQPARPQAAPRVVANADAAVGVPSSPAAPGPGPSCASGWLCGGADEVGDASVVSSSCCETLWVPGGSYPMGFSSREVADELGDDDRERPVVVSGFFLDRYEITVGRFIDFARAYAGPPPAGGGAHPLIAATGWQAGWDEELPASREEVLELTSCGAVTDPLTLARASVQPAAGEMAVDAGGDLSSLAGSVASPQASLLEGDLSGLERLNHPMVCLSWFMASAFCIWDGGRLPTEAEWEFAAAGGEQDRSFPWGDDVSVAQELLVRELLSTPTGSYAASRGRFGHDDLAGGAHEWTLDWFSESFFQRAGADCHDCANLEPQNGRVTRGDADTTCCAGWNSSYRSASRNLAAPGVPHSSRGARCARDALPE